MNKKLLSLALTGLVAGGLVACEDTTSSDGGSENTEVDTQTKITEFQEDCEGRGGVMQTNETCAGGNTCEGFNPDTGEEWTCNNKATCAGSVWCDTETEAS